jgi:hypothetical protein
VEVAAGAQGDEAVAVGEGGEDADFVGIFELVVGDLLAGAPWVKVGFLSLRCGNWTYLCADCHDRLCGGKSEEEEECVGEKG